jgi:PST family polysaccharide transporter
MTAAPARPGASSAFGWSVLNTVLSRLGTLGIGIVLARVLGPESFGTFAVALVALMAVLSFNELGVSLAIVRWPGDPARIVPTVNSISVASSAVFCAAGVFAAPAFTAAMGDPGATDVVRVLILSVFINGVVASPAALLQREFQEKKRLGIDQVNVWAGAGLSLILALAGMGAMALALGRVAGSLISAIMFLHVSPVPYRFGLDRSLVGPLLRFGLPLAGTSIIFFAVGYTDQLAAGAILGTTALGFYVLAFNLSNWSVSIIAQPLRRVAPASFAALQHDREAMNHSLVSVVSVLGCALLPPLFFLMGCSEPLVSLIYGEPWLPAVAAISPLALAAVCRVFCDLAYDFLVVLGKSGSVLVVQSVGLAALVPLLAAGGSWFGIAGIAAAQVLVTGCIVLPLYMWRISNAGVQVRTLLKAMRLPGTVGITAGLIAWMAASLIPEDLAAIAVGASAAFLMATGLLLTQAENIRHIRGIQRPARAEVPA